VSSFVYPTLPGLSIEVTRSYVWKTGYQEALSGKQSTIAYRQYPLVSWELKYNVLRDVGAAGYAGVSTSEIQSIVGLYNALHGRYDTFLYSDPDFNTITPAGAASGYGTFGTGDGSTLVFQLVAPYWNPNTFGLSELIQNLNGTPILYDNNVVISSSNYSIGATGIVTFGAGHAPALGHALTWSGSWYYRCRFDEDAIVWKRFMSKLWSGVVKFTSVKL
jgi:uncharacterized protein (TIGR02217 family)